MTTSPAATRIKEAHDSALKALRMAEEYLAHRIEGTGGFGDMDVPPTIREAIAKMEAV
jgi:hypothetical protein